MAAAAAKTVKPTAAAKPAAGANTTADIPVADWRAADLVIKSILIGESGVGKSCLLKRFASGNYLSDFYTTIGVDLEIKTFECDGKTVKLQIWDTAGQERFRTITTTYYRGAHAIMLVFDVTNAATFAAIPQWLKQVEHYAMDDSVVMLVGNKVDDVAHRTVPKEDAEKLAATLGMTYIETSAKTAHNVEDAFLSMTRAYVSRRFDKRITSTPPGGVGRRRVPDDAVSVTDANGDAACAPSWKCPGMCTIM